jgi:hypothetical protein
MLEKFLDTLSCDDGIDCDKEPKHGEYYKLVYVPHVTGSDGIFEDEGYFEFQEIAEEI